MGNRAVITFSTAPNAPCLYLHWNGGRASIEGFLAAAKDLGYHDAGSQKRDVDQLEQIIRPFFAETNRRLSIYREKIATADCDNYDNGVYVLDPKTLAIVGRRFNRYGEEVDQAKTDDIHAGLVKLNTQPACRYEFLNEVAA